MSTTREFVGIVSETSARAGAGGYPCQGLYYRRSDQQPRIAFIATHYQIDFSQHYLAEYLAERGFGFLGWNTRYRGYEHQFLLDHALVDIGAGVRWLREVAGIEKVVILGNSGGGSLMAAYQSQAVEPNVTAAEGMQLARGVDTLSPADGYVSVAAHLGRPDVLTNWMDAAVIDESDPVRTDPALDLWNPNNGVPYADDFIIRYRAAQVERNNRITAWAKSELARMRGLGFYDRPFSVYRTWADPRMVDPSIEPTKRKPNSCYPGEPRKVNRTAFGIGGQTTLRNWLGMWSLQDSQTRAQPHLARITVPSLVINANADTGVYPSDAQAMHEALGATDKESYELDGDHYFLGEGQRDTLADLIADWTKRKV
ncbi:MAG: hypothetical protein ABI137_03730 [Antricoccus sp.]